jgi:hypothetical protein
MRKKSKGKDEQCRGLKMGKEAMRKGGFTGETQLTPAAKCVYQFLLSQKL